MLGIAHLLKENMIPTIQQFEELKNIPPEESQWNPQNPWNETDILAVFKGFLSFVAGYDFDRKGKFFFEILLSIFHLSF